MGNVNERVKLVAHLAAEFWRGDSGIDGGGMSGSEAIDAAFEMLEAIEKRVTPVTPDQGAKMDPREFGELLAAKFELERQIGSIRDLVKDWKAGVYVGRDSQFHEELRSLANGEINSAK